MTPDIDAMQAGAEMDAAVAEEVMGSICTCVSGTSRYLGCAVHSARQFSTSIAAAWEVVEKVCADLCFQIDNVGFGNEDQGKWRVMIGWSDDPIQVLADADTAPLAICKAALLAVRKQ